MSHRQELADKLGAESWDGELLAMWALERITELEAEMRATQKWAKRMGYIDLHERLSKLLGVGK
jgi:hypothetical protein